MCATVLVRGAYVHEGKLVYLSVVREGLKKAFSVPLGGEPTRAALTRQQGTRVDHWAMIPGELQLPEIGSLSS